MTLDAHAKQVVAVGLAYAISILERARLAPETPERRISTT
jgi:hypothetical protein